MLDGEIDIFVWEDLQAKTRDLWKEGALITVVGRVRERDDQRVLVQQRAHALERAERARGGAGAPQRPWY